MNIKIERNPIKIIELNFNSGKYEQLMMLDYGMQQLPLREIITDEKIGVSFRMKIDLGSWLTYIADVEYFIIPINAVDLKLFLDLINQARKIYLEYFNSQIEDSEESFSLNLPPLDESETALQFEEFLNK